jgi:hypothetical protein
VEFFMARIEKKIKVIAEGLAGAALIGGTILLSPLLRPWYRRWGATDEEAQAAYPGDEWVPPPKSEITLAITLQAPVEAVWPWFVQLGCQRAGWYSYDLLDNGGIPSAAEILPQFQRLEVGDTVKAMPKGDFGFPVALLEPGRVLTLGGTLNTKTGQPAQPGEPGLEAYFSGDQTFSLKPAGDRGTPGKPRTRLFFRMRTDWNPSFLNNLIYGVIVEGLSFVMGRKMLLNLKRLVEEK